MGPRLHFSGAIVLCLLGSGCGSHGLIKVDGIVTLDGKPLPNATIEFLPESGGHSAAAMSGSDGYFRLATFSPADGVYPGRYKVVVVVPDPPPHVEARPDMKPNEVIGMYLKALQEMKKQPKKPKPDVPVVYSTMDKTPLIQEVPPEGKVHLELRNTGGS